MSTTARQYWLKVLRGLGVKNFRAKSGLGAPFICHVGDFAGEVPFYGPDHSAAEILLMAEWCRGQERPVVFDVGANNGFIATQLAQIVRGRSIEIYAFEPVPSTFAQLKLSVERLGLSATVIPICCALSDSTGITSLAYNRRESLFAQVRSDTANPRVGTERAMAATVTLDAVVASTGIRPTLLKIDVEGFEPRVFAGATTLLNSNEKPAICFEWNPLTFSELGTNPDPMLRCLGGFSLFYIDDFEGQKRPFGERIADPRELKHVCNIFAVPSEIPEERWLAVKQAATQRSAIFG